MLVVANTVLLALVTVLLALVICGSALWLRSQNRRSRGLLDGIIAVFFLIPGASYGAGLSLAYGSQRGEISLLPWISASQIGLNGTQLAICSFLTGSIPLLYYTLLAIGGSWPRRTIDTARSFGANSIKTARAVLIPASAHIVSLSLAVTAASSTVMVAPLMWVTSPETPLVVPHLIALIDHRQYEQASAMALSVSTATVCLVLATRWVILLLRQPRGA